MNNLGFRLWRSEESAGNYVDISGFIVSPDEGTSAFYEYEDTTRKSAKSDQKADRRSTTIFSTFLSFTQHILNDGKHTDSATVATA